MSLQLNAQLKGRFQFTVKKANGEVKQKTDWIDNIVLDQGLSALGNSFVLRVCRVGTGSSNPVASQTELDNQVGSTARSTQSYPETGTRSDEGYFWVRKIFRFDAGEATGDLTEVGVGWGDSGATLFNRALILDAKGRRVTVTVLEDETLDVAVELRAYYPLTPIEGQIVETEQTPEGDDIQKQYFYKIAPLFQDMSMNQGYWDGNSVCHHAYGYAGQMNSNTVAPTQYIDEFKKITHQPYENNRKREFDIYWGINQGNANPLRTVILNTKIGTFQMQVTPAIEKTPQKVLQLAFEIVWSRKE